METTNHSSISIFWFRRDLRLNDNNGLYEALRNEGRVQPLFIFDSEILDDIHHKEDRRISFIYETITALKQELLALGSDLWVFYGKPEAIYLDLFQKYQVKAVYTNHDYEPYARRRDLAIQNLAEKQDISFFSFKDQVIFEKAEVVKNDGKPYTVFTPYMRQWKNQLKLKPIKINDEKPWLKHLNSCAEVQIMLSMESLGFQPIEHGVALLDMPSALIKNYQDTRDDLTLDAGTSRLSVHLRFGTISIRQLVLKAIELNETYLNELIWREFYMQILWHFPQVVTQSFKPAYNNIPWNNNPEDFEKWCQGKTGYPIVDAAMNQLLETGFMHNRARMIVASFLTKHLLIDWRKGEAFFANHLTDYELSSNNGGWQWAASSGCDAVPYFRIFNPYAQAEKFDRSGIYVRRWHGEQGIFPIIEHKMARERCLQVFKKALSER